MGLGELTEREKKKGTGGDPVFIYQSRGGVSHCLSWFSSALNAHTCYPAQEISPFRA